MSDFFMAHHGANGSKNPLLVIISALGIVWWRRKCAVVHRL